MRKCSFKNGGSSVMLTVSILGILIVSGCGYHIGSLGPTNYRSVAVPIFRNQTMIPQLQAQITQAVIQQLHADGSVRVTGQSDADVVLEGVITEMRRESLRFQSANQAAPREYRLKITASIVLRDAKTRQPVWELKQVTGQTDYFLTDDMHAAEFQAVPLAAQDLARKIVARVTEGW